MTAAYWCTILSIIITYAFTGIAKFAQGKYDNSSPREQLNNASGWSKRAYWAHLNSLEVMPQFIGAVIIAHLTEIPQINIDYASFAFIILRIAYGVFYILDWAWYRSYCWLAGMFIIAYLITGSIFV